MKCKFTVGDYDFKFSPDQYDSIRPYLWNPPAYADVKYYTELTGDPIGVHEVLGGNVKVELKQTDLPVEAFEIVLEKLDRMATNIEGIKAPAFNAKVQVSVPSNELLRIKHIQVAYDCCTTRVQDWLNEGWSILAVCPQPDQRRPDYIFGRADKPED